MKKVKLRDVATYINGYAFKPNDWGNSGLPIIRIQDLTGTSSNPNYYNGKYPDKIEINNGDILISWSASLGVFLWNKGKALLNQHIFKVQFDKIDINKSYFIYAVKSNLNNFISKAHGATMKHIVKNDFNNIEIPLPSLEEQQHIAAVLDEISELISMRREQLQKLDLLVKARFVEMFGDLDAKTSKYEIIKLKDITYKITDGVHAKPNYVNSGRPFISVMNINQKRINFSNCKYVSEKDYQCMIKSTYPERGDILYTKVGTYGIPAYIDTDIKFCLYVSVCLIKPIHQKVNSKFLFYELDMPFIKHQADQRIKGIGVPDLHLNQIREFNIILPDRRFQNQFADFVTKVDAVKSDIQRSLDHLETLKKSKMQEYFG